MSAGNRVLITGGAGFLGSHLCDGLLNKEWEVLCLDNLLTGRKENIDHLPRNPAFKFIQQDVTLPIQVEGRLDFVLHFASPASPKDYHLFPIDTLMTGSVGTRNALELAKTKQSVFLLASTSEIYGDPEVSPQREDYWGRVNPVGPRSVYNEAKRFSEALAIAYHRAHGVKVRIARIFNTYGPRMRIDDGRVIPTFFAQAFRGETITIFGDGKQTRSFCYVSDLMEGILHLMSVENSGAVIVNLGNPQELTIGELARIILALTGSASDLVFHSLPEDDPPMRRPDISLAQKLLGWTPKVSLRDGLQRVLPYFRSQVGIP